MMTTLIAFFVGLFIGGLIVLGAVALAEISKGDDES